MDMALRESRERIRARLRKEKREQRKEAILAYFIGVFILLLTFICICEINHKSVNDCTSAGHTQEYCMEGL